MKLAGLKEVRKIFGFTMRDLAAKLGVTANAINLWENGITDVAESRLESLGRFFGVDKQLILKENHDVKDLMTIEFARSRYKLDEYKEMIKADKLSADNIIKEVEEAYSRDIDETDWLTVEGQDNYACMKTLLEKFIELYSVLPFEEYDACDDVFRDIIEIIQKDTRKWRLFEILLYCLNEDEAMEDWEDDYILFCEPEQILRKNIFDSVNQLYKKELFDKGIYAPEWYKENQRKSEERKKD